MVVLSYTSSEYAGSGRNVTPGVVTRTFAQSESYRNRAGVVTSFGVDGGSAASVVIGTNDDNSTNDDGRKWPQH